MYSYNLIPSLNPLDLNLVLRESVHIKMGGLTGVIISFEASEA